MTLLILGLVLWWASHLYPIYMAGHRASTMERFGRGPYRAAYSVVSLLAIALIVIGYRQADFINLWYPPAWTVHLNNLLMVLAILVIDARMFASPVRHYLRHPMLTGVKIWAVAHLLVNGDLASVILFGGLLAWAVVAMIGSNRRDGAWTRPDKGTTQGLAKHLAFAAVIFAVIALIHGWVLGVWPFPG